MKSFEKKNNLNNNFFQNFFIPPENELSSFQSSPVVTKKAPPPPPPQKNRSPVNIDPIKSEVETRIKTQNALPYIKRGKSTGPMKLYASQYSTVEEVKIFLDKIGDISQVTIDALGVLNGKLLFNLNDDELKEICDDDYQRIKSHLNIQRSLYEQEQQNTLQKRFQKIREKNSAVML